MMRFLLAVFFILTFIGCTVTPTENTTTLKETAYQQGYDVGYGKGYIKGGEDARIGIDDIKANAYKEGYTKGTEDSKKNQVQVVLPSSSYYHKYVGSTRLKTFHWPNCPIGSHIPFESKYWFDSCATAIDADFHPCDTCKPCN